MAKFHPWEAHYPVKSKQISAHYYGCCRLWAVTREIERHKLDHVMFCLVVSEVRLQLLLLAPHQFHFPVTVHETTGTKPNKQSHTPQLPAANAILSPQVSHRHRTYQLSHTLLLDALT